MQNFTPPLPQDRYSREYMDRLVEAVRRSFQFTLSSQSATKELLLRSPSGKVYSVTVSDAGVLTSTYVSG